MPNKVDCSSCVPSECDDNFAVLQELWDEALDASTDSEV